VVAVAESTRQHEHLILVQECRVVAEPVDVDPVGNGTGQLEGVLSFLVAIGAGGPEDQHVRGGHKRVVIFEKSREWCLTADGRPAMILLYREVHSLTRI